jgi:predicted DNA-binding protein
MANGKRQIQIPAKVAPEVRERLERLAEHLTRPGLTCSLSDAVRVAIVEGLDKLEAELVQEQVQVEGDVLSIPEEVQA